MSIRAGLSEQSNFEIILLKAAEESRSLEIDSLIETIVASEKVTKKSMGSSSFPKAVPSGVGVISTEVEEGETLI